MYTTKIQLEESEMPTQFYNILPRLPKPLDPPLHPGTKQPIGPADLAPLFPMELIKQEMSMEKMIDIPEEVQKVLKLYRPTPLYRAHRLERELQTTAKIYYKYEGVSPSGSHKTNSALVQAYYNKKEGVKNLITETGAGQWGSALAFACNVFGIHCTVYMVATSFASKPYRKTLMRLYGAEVYSSPSPRTNYGKKILAQNPDHTGSLGIAISEALEEVVASGGKAKYALGSVLNHVLLHQTIIGLETKKQFEKIDAYPDIVIGCVGGGSNFAGLALPFIGDKLEGKIKNLRAIAVEPTSTPSLTKGEYRYDFGDTAGMTPLLKMKTLGNEFIPDPIHAGGLRYHGMSPIISALHEQKIIEAKAYQQIECFEAAQLFAKTEGIIPAPESSHAIRAAMDEALVAKEAGTSPTIVFNLSGHGHFDMQGYADFMDGKL